MDETYNWYCALIDKQNIRGVKDVVDYIEDALFDIFGNDFGDLHVIGEQLSEEEFDIQTESYFFFCCRNYGFHIDAIKQCPVISLVLPSYTNPEPVPTYEIEKFTATVTDKNNVTVCPGDIVYVRTGYLKELQGIVVKVEGDVANVIFCFYTLQFVEQMIVSNLIPKGNMFEKLRIPLKKTSEQKEKGLPWKDMSETVSDYIKENALEDKICRRLHRTHVSKKSFKS